MVTQTVVVNGEWALRSKEHWNVSVVCLTDCLAVQSLLNKFSDITRVLLDVFNVVQFVFFWILDHLLSFARGILPISIHRILRVVGVQGAVVGEQ